MTNIKGLPREINMFITKKRNKGNKLRFLCMKLKKAFISGLRLVGNTEFFLIALREKCPDATFFWSVFCLFRSECGDLQSKFPYFGPEKIQYLEIFAVF